MKDLLLRARSGACGAGAMAGRYCRSDASPRALPRWSRRGSGPPVGMSADPAGMTPGGAGGESTHVVLVLCCSKRAIRDPLFRVAPPSSESAGVLAATM